jgi:hypothetical protein
MGEPEGVPSEALLTPLWGQPLPFAPFPVAPWRARETPPPFRGKGMGIYPFPTPCRGVGEWVFTHSPHPVGCGRMGGERARVEVPPFMNNLPGKGPLLLPVGLFHVTLR